MALDVLHLAQGTCRPYQSCPPRTLPLPQTLPMSTSTGTSDTSSPAILQQGLDSLLHLPALLCWVLLCIISGLCKRNSGMPQC